ncbi:MAG: hypothetical protein MZV70_46825 [Desulfobacterales bacterium]|nr:hypothetical protein [Desulfobacterales bacterium]
MIVTWQVLNAVTYPKRQQATFPVRCFVVAPGLTVKERLQVLYPGDARQLLRRVRPPAPCEAMRQQLNQMLRSWSRTGTP